MFDLQWKVVAVVVVVLMRGYSYPADDVHSDPYFMQ